VIGYWRGTVVCLSVSDKVCCGAIGSALRFESCIAVFLGGHFLFTSSDTFAVLLFGRITLRKPNSRNFCIWNGHGQRGHVTMATSDAAFLALRFCSSTIGVLSDSYASCSCTALFVNN